MNTITPGAGGGGSLAPGWYAYDSATLAPLSPYTDIRCANLTVTGTATITSTATATAGFIAAAQAAFVAGPFGTSAGNTGEARFLELAANGVNYVGFKAPDSLAANTVYLLPTAFPASDMVLQSTSAGVLTWVTVSGANAALSNLASVAINTTLVSDTDITDDLGTATIRWNVGYFATLDCSGAADTIGSSLDAANGLRLGSGKLVTFSSTTAFDGTVDLTAARLGAANLRQGAAPSATPVAQTFTLGEASRPGTDTNTAGASGTIQSGLGTGTGTASSLIVQTPTVAGSGSGVQAYATRLTINSTSATFVPSVVVPNGSATTCGLQITAAATAGLYKWGVANAPALADTTGGGCAAFFSNRVIVVSNGAFAFGDNTALDSISSYFGSLSSPATNVLRCNGTGLAGIASFECGTLFANKTADYAGPTAVESRTCYTNSGAGGAINITLLTAVAGYEYEFVVEANQYLKITAATGDLIRLGTGGSSATGGYIRSTTVGAMVRIKAIDATTWQAVSIEGTWTIDS